MHWLQSECTCTQTVYANFWCQFSLRRTVTYHNYVFLCSYYMTNGVVNTAFILQGKNGVRLWVGNDCTPKAAFTYMYFTQWAVRAKHADLYLNLTFCMCRKAVSADHHADKIWRRNCHEVSMLHFLPSTNTVGRGAVKLCICTTVDNDSYAVNAVPLFHTCVEKCMSMTISWMFILANIIP